MGITTCKVILFLIPIGLAYIYLKFTRTDPIPNVLDEYWGPKSELYQPQDTSIRPFKINVPNIELNDLKSRLKRELSSNKIVPPLEGVGFEYGFNSNYLKTVGKYWLEKYDWKAREKLLNKYPQFKTKIGGLDIHFYHIKPKAKDGVEIRPLLLLHGWPGSVVEYQKIAPLLSEPKNSKFNYELIIPSLPGYGFSSPAGRPGLNAAPIANIFKRLMERLGHKKFYVMGGDWGALITHDTESWRFKEDVGAWGAQRERINLPNRKPVRAEVDASREIRFNDMATLYPDRVLGAHSLNCVEKSEVGILRQFISSYFPKWFERPEVAKHILPWAEFVTKAVLESGYSHIQATKPDTLSIALTQSPLGLAAYILEKFSTWTNPTWISKEDDGIQEKFTLDELLDNVMVYWITGSITTANRLYSEGLVPSKKPNLDRVPTKVPLDCYCMPGDIFIFAELSVRHKFTNIKRYSIAPRGGHFGAFEEPELLAQDALSFFNSL